MTAVDSGRQLVDQDDGRRDNERGNVALWVMFLGLVALVLVALVHDGAGALQARQEAAVAAGQASRAAADQLDVDSLRTGGAELAVGPAVQAGQAYLRQVGARGSVDVDGEVVTVTVTDRYEPRLLSAVGAAGDGMRIEAKATARAVEDNNQAGGS